MASIEYLSEGALAPLKFGNRNRQYITVRVGVGAAVGVAAPVVVLGGLALTGFGAGGVVAGSVAAAIQSSIGSVAAGSLFASMYCYEFKI